MSHPPAFDYRHYVPCLRWKQGEYQALLRLPSNTKEKLTPLIEVAEIGWDFENEEDAKTVDEHLENFAQRVRNKWGDRWAFIDLKLIPQSDRMNDKRHPLKFVFDDLRAKGALGIPVTGINRDKFYQEAVLDAISQDKNGVCIRATIQEAAREQFEDDLNSLLNELKIQPEKVDFILDLEAPNFEPLDGFTKMVKAVSGKLSHLSKCRTYTICGTSFPQTMGQLDLGVKIEKRSEWLFYKLLLTMLGPKDRTPTFGDYAITHPQVAKIDMRLVKPAASVRYTIDDAWYIAKGPNVRDNGNAQYYGHCAKLVSSGLYMGQSFSAGDDHISKCAKQLVKSPGNLTTWRWVGTNHHIQKVVIDIANLHDS